MKKKPTLPHKSVLLIICFVFSITLYAQNWEVQLLDNINPTQPNSSLWINTSKSVYPLAIAAPASLLAVGLIKKDKKLQRQGWEMVGALAINTVVTQGLKFSINRNRPYETYPTLIHPYQADNDPSFPSGHTSTAFAVATTLSIQCKKWYVVVPAFTWATAVGYSRLYLGQHYPTDVLAGAAVGAGSAYLSHWLNKKLFKNK